MFERKKKPVADSVEGTEGRFRVDAPLRAGEVALDAEPLPEDEVVSGTPAAGSAVVRALGGVEVGLWEMTPGTARDIEEDEVFVVLSGRASIEFENGERVTVGAGDVMSLFRGQRTVWKVTERLRKVYIVAPDSRGAEPVQAEGRAASSEGTK